MIRTYTTYALTILSAFMVYWMFGVMTTVAAGYSWLPFLAFLASVIHFGVSSWLYLNLPKVGKGLAILTALLMCIWPIAALIGSVSEGEQLGILFYSIPILFSGIVVYNHIKTFNNGQRPSLLPRVILSVIPAGLLIAYILYLIQLIRNGQWTFS